MNVSTLSPMDSAFLQVESGTTPTHVAGLMVFDLPEGAPADFVAGIVQRFRACTVFTSPWNKALVTPRRKQLLTRVHEVHDLDMEYHVRHLALPRPGGERELGQLIARLHSQVMDLRKPLWECHVIEGLGATLEAGSGKPLPGSRFAIYLKLHHAMADGVSATRMILRALATSADDPDQLPFWAAQPARRSDAPKAAKPKPAPLKLSDFATLAREAGRIWFARGDDENVSLRTAPRSILNQRIHTQRRFATHAEPVARLKAIAKAADASLNDIVLSATGMALREYLTARDALPEKGLVASIPVSLRDADDESTGNAVAMIFASLGTHIADDRKRLEVIKASAANAKARLQQLPPALRKAQVSLVFSPFIASLASGLGGRFKPSFNVMVSNVPGASEERYLYGARLAHIYPVSIPFHGVALNVTCLSHAGTLNFGLTACRDSLPHMQQIAVGIGRAIDRLEALYVG